MTLTAAQQSKREDSRSPGGGISDYGQEELHASGGESAAALAAATAIEQGTLPPHWYVYTDPRGVFYYHNPYLNITQWERPPGAAPLDGPKNEAGSLSPTMTPTEEEEEDACTLNLSAAADLSRISGEAASIRHGRGTKSATTTGGGGGRRNGGNRPSDGFLSLASITASSPLDMLQRAQQQQQSERMHAGTISTITTTTGGGEHVYYPHLTSDSTAASSRLSHVLYDKVSPAGDIGGGSCSASIAAGGKRSSSSPEEISWLLRCCGCINLYAALQRLFAVTTDDIFFRLRFALFPYRKLGALLGDSNTTEDDVNSALELLKRPDMYGPFWVATTLVVLAFACSNFPVLLSPAAAAGAAADVRRLGQAAAAVYGCFLLPPVVVWAALQYYRLPHQGTAADNAPAVEVVSAAATRERDTVSSKSSPPALEQLLCLQGYAFTPLCVCSTILLLLQIFPIHTIVTVFKWTAVGAAGVAAAVFLFQQLRQLLHAQPFHVKSCCFVLLIGTALLLLFLLMRFASVGYPQPQATPGKTLGETTQQGRSPSSGTALSPSAASAATTDASVETNGSKDVAVPSSASDPNKSSLSDDNTSPEADTEGNHTDTKPSSQRSPALLHLDGNNTSSVAKASLPSSPLSEHAGASLSDTEPTGRGEQLLQANSPAAEAESSSP